MIASRTKGEGGRNLTTRTYVMYSPGLAMVKIGRSSQVPKRFADLRRMNADPEFRLIGSIEGDQELVLHSRFSYLRAHDEFFRIDEALQRWVAVTFGVIVRHTIERRRAKITLHKVKRKRGAAWALRWYGSRGKRYCETIGKGSVMTKRQAEAVRRDRQGKIDNGLSTTMAAHG